MIRPSRCLTPGAAPSLRRWNAQKGLNLPFLPHPRSPPPGQFHHAGFGSKGYLIVPLTPQTKRDPQYMRVSKLLTAHSDLTYGVSVTTQYPGVAMVRAEMGWVRAPLELTDKAPNCVTVVVPLKTLL